MNTEELEGILEGGGETQRVDFKASVPWSIEHFIKDILAMSNVEGGGMLVIGVDEAEGSFSRSGIKSEDNTTYEIDKIRDQVSDYADPHVGIQLYHVNDNNETPYLVLKVNPFDQIPVICKKQHYDVNNGKMYYRANSGRPASREVCNSSELRDILDRATVKLMQRYQGLGLNVGSEIQKVFEAERGEL
ncbi:MAG: hypothetical protein ACD_61C00040G0002 [uncultured bacterium]|nr:MAG: hypothetical protein ACD_61C00040G0002 [uncultured bacterium]